MKPADKNEKSRRQERPVAEGALVTARGKLSGRSFDVFLYVIIIVLLNILGASAFFRLDLTRSRTYSLSPASRTMVRSLQEPLSIEVFFSRDLPAPYNSVDRYVEDLLTEYDQKANRNFSFQFHDMDLDESKTLADSLGIYPAQIQEFKSDQLSARSVYMGIAVIYGDLIETIPQVTSTDGLEYRLTTLVTRMAGKADALLALREKISITLYASSTLKEFSIAGFDTLGDSMADLAAQLNRENYNTIEYHRVDPSTPEEVDALVSRYGLQKMTWRRDRSGAAGTGGTDAAAAEGSAVLGIVLELGDKFRVLPLSVQRQLFGGYQVTGLSDIGEKLGNAIGALVSKNPRVGYLTGHGEHDIADAENGSALFETINSDLYEFVGIDLAQEGIPDDIRTLVIDGPLTRIPDEQLFAIDQFLMAGGSLFVFLDSYREFVPPAGNQYQQSQPVYIPLDTGLGDLLSSYGLTVNKDIVLDTKCYIARQSAFGGDLPVYYIPILEKESINQNHPVTKSLARIILLRTSSITLDESTEGTKRDILLESSGRSWLMTDRIDLTPYFLSPPAEEEMGQYILGASMEGNFTSYFTEPPVPSRAEADDMPRTSEDGNIVADSAAGTDISTGGFIPASIRPGKVVVISGSELTTAQLIDPEGQTPNAIFLHNVMDYLNGNTGLIQMRGKGLSYNPLRDTSPGVRAAIKAVNIGGLPLLAILMGLVVWRYRTLKRRKIREQFEGAGKDE